MVEVTPVMNKVGPDFKKDAPVNCKVLESNDPNEIAETLKREGEILIDGLRLTDEYVTSRKKLLEVQGRKLKYSTQKSWMLYWR